VARIQRAVLTDRVAEAPVDVLGDRALHTPAIEGLRGPHDERPTPGRGRRAWPAPPGQGGLDCATQPPSRPRPCEPGYAGGDPCPMGGVERALIVGRSHQRSEVMAVRLHVDEPAGLPGVCPDESRVRRGTEVARRTMSRYDHRSARGETLQDREPESLPSIRKDPYIGGRVVTGYRARDAVPVDDLRTLGAHFRPEHGL